MSTYKHLADLLKLCSVLPALAIMPAMADTAQYTNPADVINWSNNEYKATDSKRTGGVLKVAGGDKIDEINAGEVKGNSITMTKTDGYNSEVFGQGSVLYNNGTIGKITGTFENNSITNMSATASKATANGGAFALYAGTNIDSIQAGFTGNSVTAQYSGDGTTSYADGNQISAGGGAMHIQGAFGDGDVTIGTIAGDFTNNSANGDGYANGGAIYIKGGANDRDIPDEYAVHIGKIEGDFTGNKATATTGTTKNKKNSTGGAISVKIDSEKGENGDVVIDEIVGNFANNSVQTNTTDALGGAIYNEGTVKVTGDFSENTATATSTEGKGYGGAIYNVGTMSVGGTFTTNTSTNKGGAIYNSGTLNIADGSVFEDNNANNGGAIWNEQGATLSFANTKLVEFKHNVAGNAGGAIYNAGVIDKISHVSFQKNEGKLAGAINNSNLIGKNQGGYIGEISNSSFIDNNAGTSQGGAIRNQGRIDKIADVLFSGNRSGNGGALNNGTWGSVVSSITDVEFSGNIAEGGEGQGGAIVNAGNIALIDDSEFNSNRADKIGGAIANVEPSDGDGTAIATIKYTNFTGNIAGEMGGAIYNDERGKIVLGGENLFSGNTAAGVANDIHNEGALVISDGVTKLGGGITGTGNLTIAKGATLSIGTTSIQQSEIALNGTLAAQIVNEKSFAKIQTENIVVGENGVLDLMLGSVGTYNIGVMVPEAKIAYNDSVYNVKFNEDNNMVVSLKSVAEIAENNGVSSNAAAVLTGLMSSQDDTLNIAALNVQEALARGDTEYVETGTAKLLPQDKPVAQSVATSVQNQVLSVATNRMSGAMVAGRNGGDFANAEYGVWAQGLYNHSKYADEFTGDTMGIAVGADALIADKYTIGIGYAYNESDVEAKNDVDITSNSLFVYGQYKPNQWYVNGTLNYTMSNYTNKVAAFGIVHDEEYDVDSFGGQLMGGYDMAFGLTPEAGVRYLHIAQDGYNSVLGAVSDASYDYLTGVIGAKYAFTIESGSDWLFRPELRAAATYDFMSDESIATVDIPGVGSYVMPGERLSRFGGEFGIGLAALYNGWEISVNYDLDLHQDYTSHTGMLKFRYDF